MPDQDFAAPIRDALRRGAVEDALAQARDAVTADRGDANAHRWLATAQHAAGEQEQALASIERAIELAPEDANAHFERAALLLGEGHLDAAQAALARSIGLDPNLFGAYVMQAQLALGRGDLDEAERQRRLASRIAPEQAQIRAIEAMLLLRRGDAAAAQAVLATALERSPQDAQLNYALGFAYMAQGHLAFAEQVFRNLLQQSPDAGNLRTLVAELVRRQGRPEEALEQLAPLLGSPDRITPALRVWAGELELEAGRPERALNWLREALGAQPDDRRTLEALIEAWRRLGDADDARATLDAAVSDAPEVTALWHARLAFEPAGSDHAGAVVDRWVAATPDAVYALEARMALQDMAGDKAGAEDTARRIVEIEPGRSSAEMRILTALIDREPTQAVSRLEALIEQATVADTRTMLRLWLGLALDRADRPVEAAALWAELQAAAAPQRLPIPDVSEPPGTWPDPAPRADAAIPTAFLWGPPGSGVDRVAGVLSGVVGPFRADRMGPQPPPDLLQSYRTVGSLRDGSLDPASLVADWQAHLPQRAISDGRVIDWLAWWDNSLLLALRPHLPDGMLLVVLRDPRDMLLDWLAFGIASPPIAMPSPMDAARWLAKVLDHVLALETQDLYPHRLLRLDSVIEDPAALTEQVGAAIETPMPAPLAVAFGIKRFPAGHWRRYREALAEPFALLTPIARQLGYE